jgi:hypothetical protein
VVCIAIELSHLHLQDLSQSVRTYLRIAFVRDPPFRASCISRPRIPSKLLAVCVGSASPLLRCLSPFTGKKKQQGVPLRVPTINAVTHRRHRTQAPTSLPPLDQQSRLNKMTTKKSILYGRAIPVKQSRAANFFLTRLPAGVNRVDFRVVLVRLPSCFMGCCW